MRRRLLRVLVPLTAACSTPPAAAPRLELLSETTLMENDSSFIGVVSGFALSSSGSFLVADKRNATLHEFGRDGAHVRRVGRRGEGPGEWANGPQLIVWGDDSTFVVADGFMARALSYPSIVERWHRLRPTWSLPMGYVHGTFIFNRVDAASRSSLEFLRGVADSAVRGGPFTAMMGRNPILDNYFSFLAVAPMRGDSIGVFVMNTDRLFVGSLPVGPWDSVDVPTRHRRGAVPAVMAELGRGNTAVAEKNLYVPSFPVALAFLPGSRDFALVTSDRAMVGGSRMMGKLYLSVVRWRTRRACVDAPLALPEDPQPMVTFRGDTLFAIAQVVEGDQPRTTIKAFRIDTRDCDLGT